MAIDLQKINKIYFIGIGGIMMSAVAKYFLAQGKEIYGSDRDKSPIVLELEKLGAEINIGQRAENINKDLDLVVYTVAIGADNPEWLKSRKLKLKNLAVYKLLGLLAREKFTITVSGMHGKSTTTSILGLLLERAKLDPTVFVGTEVKEWGSNFRLGQSRYLLSEGCEYKDNFLNYHPDIAVVTNIEAEHLDYFKNLAGVKKSFRKFVGQIKKGGWLVVNGDNKNAREMLKNKKTRKQEIKEKNNITTFGLGRGVDIRAKDIRINNHGETEFKLKTDKRFGEYNNKIFKLKVPGEFNIYNALGAIAVAAILKIKPVAAQKTLVEFGGVWRRFEYKGQTKNGVEIYDDYGHHPTEIEATLKAAKEKFKNKKLWVVFQPHLYSRTHDFKNDFAKALNLADEVIVVDIYAAREVNKYKVSSQEIVEMINKKYRRRSSAKYIPNFNETAEYLKKNLKKGEVVMTMGAGEAYKVGERLLNS